MNKDIFEYYGTHGYFTEPGDLRGALPALPEKIKPLCLIVQNNMIHAHWLERYSLSVPEERKNAEMNIRTFHDRLKNILEHNGSFAGDVPALKEKRTIGTCRDYSVMLCALLREKGIPARERCGFGTYFTPEKFEDHWVCEWWNDQEKLWVLTDAQLEPFQSEILKLDFDPADVPRDRFIPGGKAWLMCRKEGFDPESFGIFDMRGMDFIKGNLLRDAAALNKVPLLPWDCWGLMNSCYETQSAEELSFLDNLAELIGDPDGNFDRIRNLYKSDSRIKMTGSLESYSPVGGSVSLEDFQ